MNLFDYLIQVAYKIFHHGILDNASKKSIFKFNNKFIYIKKNKNNNNYFASSDPHHDMLGGGCQVRVVIENILGRMKNLRKLISGFLGLVILVRWALVTMFLS